MVVDNCFLYVWYVLVYVQRGLVEACAESHRRFVTFQIYNLQG